MKEVIEVVIAPDKVTLENINPLEYFIAIDKNGKVCVLRYEAADKVCQTGGWIFRYWFGEFGLVGTHLTQQEAIKSALKYATVFQFANMDEAVKWLQLNKYII